MSTSNVAVATTDGRGVGAGSIEHATTDRCKGGVRRIGVVRANLVAEAAAHSPVVVINCMKIAAVEAADAAGGRIATRNDGSADAATYDRWMKSREPADDVRQRGARSESQGNGVIDLEGERLVVGGAGEVHPPRRAAARR